MDWVSCGLRHLGLKITQAEHPLTGLGTWTEVRGKFANWGYLVLDSGSSYDPVGYGHTGVHSLTDFMALMILVMSFCINKFNRPLPQQDWKETETRKLQSIPPDVKLED